MLPLTCLDGRGRHAGYVGVKVWPKFGFDAPLLLGETANAPHLTNCTTVQDIIALDEPWWMAHGTQRRMVFDLMPHSTSWRKLIPYANGKISEGSQ